ncbi:MAG: alpha-ketoacid dehydrogenase subunit beta [Gemmatales bacterium]|nr:alpha-ketoacid dehydrogenase subunit beta [Gemmatales bacterium]MCS7160541.1 alpha-ketoacid dehydrogenase subunit beta [Gemmatales bacterium]MDW8175742.1 alpha-ketoacid dehydrogenase subunit beta [Gemmatales bacterium]MDW8221891.1 alpha-ketoacid dehydrogenase subunit beta [Gemmatales bacterium]
MALRNMVQALNLALRQEMAKDERVVVFGEDVARQGGVFRVTEGLLDQFGGRRVFDTPVSEAGIIGISTGLALAGMRPVCEIQFSGFMFNALHQLGLMAARYRCRSRGLFSVPMVVRAPWGGGVRALELHNESEEAVYAQMPGLKVVIPSRPRRARALLLASIRDPDPVVFLEPKRVYRSLREEVPDDEEVFPIGEAEIIRHGRHLTLITYGALLQECLQAVEQAERDFQVSIEVIDLLTIVPLDTRTIVESVQKTGRCVVVHEAPRSCGIASEIIARINEQCLLYLHAPVARVTGYDIPYPFFAREHAYLPNVPRILDAIRRTLEF